MIILWLPAWYVALGCIESFGGSDHASILETVMCHLG